MGRRERAVWSGLALGFFEAEDKEEDGEDILHGTRAGPECAEVAKGYKDPGTGNACVKVRCYEGASRARVRVSGVG